MYFELLAARRTLVAFALVSSALVLQGCGGGGDGGGDGGGGGVGLGFAAGFAGSTVDSGGAAVKGQAGDTLLQTAAGASVEAIAEDPASADASPGVVASAGSDQVVDQAVDVVLDGSASASRVDKALLSFNWKQIDGPAVTLADASSAHPMFKTPFVTAATVLSFALTVNAAGTSATSKVSVTVNRDSPWGVAPSAALSYNPEAWMPAMADAGVTTVRGFYTAPTYDRLAPITASNMAPVGFLQWSSGATQSLPADDLPGWRRYVTAQVTRYKGRVKHWEVWNEPPNFTADRSPVSYARVVAAAFDAAKAVDPTVQIGLAAKSNHINWLAETIAAGAADKFDFVTLHPYEVASFLPQGWEGQFMGIVPGVRKMLQDKNPARATVPVWFTEIGTSAETTAATGVGPQMQADVLIKIYTMAIAQGVARAYWFDPSDSEGLTMGLTTADGTKRPAWYAMRSMSKYLGARPKYVGWTQPGHAYYGFVFEGPQGVVMSAWSRPGQAALLSLASDVSVIDPHTGMSTISRTPNVTDAPVVLVAPAGSAQARQWLSDAAANGGKPFAWNGEHSASASVSLTAGAAPDGVFMANPPAVTVVNGVGEFDLQGSGGASFAVDPAFLSYTTSPVRITVVVRGHGSGDPGFNLKYESDVPIAAADGNGLVGASGGWFRVVGTSFYEKTWTLPNARFVGMYGYNFSFDSDGPSHAQFSIQRVTVSR